jgi:hypothetical protein
MAISDKNNQVVGFVRSTTLNRTRTNTRTRRRYLRTSRARTRRSPVREKGENEIAVFGSAEGIADHGVITHLDEGQENLMNFLASGSG